MPSASAQRGAGPQRRRDRREVGDLQQLGDVHVLGGQAGAQHVVGGRHDLDAEARRVGVDHARGDEHRLARGEHDVVEQQGHQHARRRRGSGPPAPASGRTPAGSRARRCSAPRRAGASGAAGGASAPRRPRPPYAAPGGGRAARRRTVASRSVTTRRSVWNGVGVSSSSVGDRRRARAGSSMPQDRGGLGGVPEAGHALEAGQREDQLRLVRRRPGRTARARRAGCPRRSARRTGSAPARWWGAPAARAAPRRPAASSGTAAGGRTSSTDRRPRAALRGLLR